MTLAMWFVWLLRGDIREGASVTDWRAQAEFTCWWLLWAHTEYPAVFAWGHTHAALAMEPVALKNGLACPRLLMRLHAARHDLQRAFPLDGLDSLADYFCWYRLHGPVELAAAPSLPNACLAVTEAPGADHPAVPRMAVALSRRIPGLPGSVGTGDARHPLVDWYTSEAPAYIPNPTPPLSHRPTANPDQALRTDGVNLVGFPNKPSGLGEDIRMISAALIAAAVPHVLIDVDEMQRPAGGYPPTNSRPVFATSIFCMSPFDMATLYLTRGPAFFAGQYRIGYWPWELPRLPDIWTDAYDLVDEIWAASEFTAAAYRANCPKPVLRLPAPVCVPAVRRRKLAMIKPDNFVFTYPFDPQSYLARKNPVALVRAFRMAFPTDNDVTLLLRVNGTLAEGPDRTILLHAIDGDDRIVVLEETLERSEALALTASCHCLVSPHRAEGFGRNIVEAIVLRVPVLATGFSGCMDYLVPDETFAFELRQVATGEYPFGDGLFWAEPVIADMAARMRQLRMRALRNGRAECRRLARRAARLAAAYAPSAAGRAFLERLETLRLISPLRDSGAWTSQDAAQAAQVGVFQPGEYDNRGLNG